jgi:hypothetical protein
VKFMQHDLGWQNRGELVEVTLSGNEANVLLLDDSNLRRYKAGNPYSYTGGHVTKSPIRLQIPHGGNWHVVVNLGGFGGTVRSSVRVMAR